MSAYFNSKNRISMWLYILREKYFSKNSSLNLSHGITPSLALFWLAFHQIFASPFIIYVAKSVFCSSPTLAIIKAFSISFTHAWAFIGSVVPLNSGGPTDLKSLKLATYAAGGLTTSGVLLCRAPTSRSTNCWFSFSLSSVSSCLLCVPSRHGVILLLINICYYLNICF